MASEDRNGALGKTDIPAALAWRSPLTSSEDRNTEYTAGHVVDN